MVNFYIFITEIAIENEHFNGLVLKSVSFPLLCDSTNSSQQSVK